MSTLYRINSFVYQLFSSTMFPTPDKTIAAIPRHKGTGLFQWPLAWQTSWGTPSKKKPGSQWKLQEELKRFGPWGWKQCWKPCPGSSKGLHEIAKRKKKSPLRLGRLWLHLYWLLLTFFTVWALETRMALAGIVPNCLHAVCMSTTRILQTRGCVQAEVTLPWTGIRYF